MGVYRKVGEDEYQQLDSRGNGHILHLQSNISFQNKSCVFVIINIASESTTTKNKTQSLLCFS